MMSNCTFRHQSHHIICNANDRAIHSSYYCRLPPSAGRAVWPVAEEANDEDGAEQMDEIEAKQLAPLARQVKLSLFLVIRN